MRIARHVGALALLGAVLVSACGDRTGLFAPEGFCSFPDATAALDLVNDTALTADAYVKQCNFTVAEASAIAKERPFASLDELAASMKRAGFGGSFCADFIACAKAHEQNTCTPGNHPTVILELVVDESGSMEGEKWDALRDSLLALFDEIEKTDDTQLQIGLVTFDDLTHDEVKPAPLTQAGHLAELRKAIDVDSPEGGGTATKAALDVAYGVVNKTTGGVRRVLILFSDGTPTGGRDEQRRCEELVKKENADHGTELFSVGIGTFPATDTVSYDPNFMGRLAVAGATAPKGCDPSSDSLDEICHYQVTPGNDPALLQKQLGAALDAIRSEVTTCP